MFIVGVDLETTGLEEDDEIVELGAVLFDTVNNRVVNSYNRIYKVHEWGEEAAECHRIPLELSNLMDYADRDPHDPWHVIDGDRAKYVVAHNASHDHKFIKKVWPSFLTRPWLCTKSDLRHDDLLKRVASTRLGHLCVDYEIKMGTWHQALADAEACARIAAKHDLDAAFQRKTTPKYKLICEGAFIKDVKDLLRESPSSLKDQRWYRWNAEEGVWYKENLFYEDLEGDARYISSITKGKWSFRFEDMPDKEY